MGHRIAVHQQIALLDPVALLHGNVLAFGNEVFDRLHVFAVGPHDDPPFGFVILAEFDAAGSFADDRVVLRLARLEQFGDPRQTPGDVPGFG